MSASPVELLGYAASVLVALSLTMGEPIRLRALNLAGAVAFVAYAGLIRAWPVLAVNLFICGVDAYYLARLWAARPAGPPPR